MFDVFFEDSSLWFTIPALVGSGLFLLRVLLMLVGVGDFDADLEADIDPDLDTDSAFQVLSIQTIFGFMMGFGWAGLLAMHTFKIEGLLVDALIAIAGGVAVVWVIGLAMKGMREIQSSGNVDIGDTVGLEGSVYATVPGSGNGRGKVQVVIGNKQRMFNAVTEGEDLPSRSRVRITKANGDNSVTVIGL